MLIINTRHKVFCNSYIHSQMCVHGISGTIVITIFTTPTVTSRMVSIQSARKLGSSEGAGSFPNLCLLSCKYCNDRKIHSDSGNAYMYVCMYVCMFYDVYVYINYTYIYMYVYMCVYIYIYMCVCVYIYIYVFI